MIVSLATRQPSLTCGHRNHRKEQTSLRARRAWQPPDAVARLRFALLQPDRGCRVASLLAMTLVLSGRFVQALPYGVCTIKSDLLHLIRVGNRQFFCRKQGNDFAAIVGDDDLFLYPGCRKSVARRAISLQCKHHTFLDLLWILQ